MERQLCFSFNSQVFAFWERSGSGGAVREVPSAGLALKEMEGPWQQLWRRAERLLLQAFSNW